ncbi:ankyrin repeat family protein [Trifolium medium]|uniref:Ankyrin repeat family protein n=1 Tax=Trifolium medium TaxID=97028 RepID=A0A392NP91_9FABA|nr:ankyrin repeat family protein [Trifolium medium]
MLSLLLPTARQYNNSYYQPFHLAIVKGDWESTKAFLDNDPSALTAKITMFGQTALHVAALGAHWKLVEKLVQHMPANMLTEMDFKNCTCLHYVAMGESIDTAKALVAKNSSVTQVTNLQGSTPLHNSLTAAAICKEMVWYLVLNATDDSPACPFSGPSATELVRLLIYTGLHGN